MKQLIKNAQITKIYWRKQLKGNSWRHYALIGTDKDKGKWIWANDYLNKKWTFKQGERYDFYIHAFFKGKHKGMNFLHDYCLAGEPKELKKQFRRQWLSKTKPVGKIVTVKPKHHENLKSPK